MIGLHCPSWLPAMAVPCWPLQGQAPSVWSCYRLTCLPARPSDCPPTQLPAHLCACLLACPPSCSTRVMTIDTPDGAAGTLSLKFFAVTTNLANADEIWGATAVRAANRSSRARPSPLQPAPCCSCCLSCPAPPRRTALRHGSPACPWCWRLQLMPASMVR